jgi:signal-transduction protein with cAMP-binding, CBS, and nucleotidyltransferase domain
VFYIFIGYGAWQIFNGNVISGIWIAVIGWFLMSSARGERAAQSGDANKAMSSALSFPVEIATEQIPPAIDESRSVQSVLDELTTESDQVSIPVTKAGELVGFVTSAEISFVAEESRSISKIGQVMDPRSLRVIDSSESAGEALRLLDLHRVSQLVVMGNGMVLGLTNRQSILKKMLEMQSARETYTRPNPTDDLD